MVPDYAFTGTGVRAESVTSGSPAAVAGLQGGDVLIELGGTPLVNLSAFSDKLKTLAPGDKVKAVVMRGSERLEKSMTLTER
jgi:S1-C subfamily serine protease